MALAIAVYSFRFINTTASDVNCYLAEIDDMARWHLLECTLDFPARALYVGD